jgi:hypothetical protein
MPEYGVTKDGFVIKPFADILADKAARAQAMFGPDVDLRSTSALRKLLDISSFEDQELWKRSEQLYYSNFLSTASGDALDLLGADAGVARQSLRAAGTVKLKLTGGAPGRTYHFPLGTLVETAPPAQRFRSLALVSLSDQQPEAEVAVEALARGPAGNVAANAIDRVNSVYAQRNLNLGAATAGVKNAAALTGGEIPETDDVYRVRLLGYPRTLWTLESVRQAVKSVDGVRDTRLFDPLGGVDVSLSKFQLFAFSQRRFGTQRLLGTPYFFDVLVAGSPGFPWESQPGLIGVRDSIEAAIREVRPISIFPNVRQANNVTVGLRARVLVKPGHDRNGVVASLKEKLARRVDALGLGGSVLFSEVQCDCMAVAGVVDVQQLHLRRCPPLLAGVSFGPRQKFQGQVIEAAVGENIDLLPNEVAVFQVDSGLIDVEVTDR